MSNIFDFTDYRAFLGQLVENRSLRRVTRSKLAAAMSCQAAYLSQVLKGKAELTEDHGVKLCQYLGFNDKEIEYFLVILRLARSGSPALTKFLEGQRQTLQSLHREAESRISSTKVYDVSEAQVYYCSSWIPAVVHVATTCEAYQTAATISQRFALEKATVEYHLQMLEKHGLVKFQSGRWIYHGSSFHIPKQSPFDPTFQIQRRLQVIENIAQRKSTDVHYANVFSVDEKTFAKMRELFIATIENIHKLGEPAPSENVYTLCLDLFQA